jgi:hypothetical protein
LFRSSTPSAVIPLGKMPGEIAFTRTRTPGRLNSCARSALRWMLAALLALYLTWCCDVRVMPEMLAMLITPCGCFSVNGRE